MTIAIRELSSDADLLGAFTVMVQLRPHLKHEEYLQTVRRMMDGGYRQAASFDGPRAAGVAGFRIIEMLHVGLHLYVDDLVTDETARSSGHGAALMGWLVEQARLAGCVTIELDSGTQRKAAHRFYLRERFEISGFHFRREIPREHRLRS